MQEGQLAAHLNLKIIYRLIGCKRMFLTLYSLS